MAEEATAERHRALEDAFFQRASPGLRTALQAEGSRESERARLAEGSGITRESLLERLIDLGIGAETFAALSLVPLVEVAWANGRVEEEERRALERAALAHGIDERHPAFGLYSHWLHHRPDPRLVAAWTTCVEELCRRLEPARRDELRAEFLDRARGVAEAAGGFLGLGNRVSPEEETILGVLARAFDQP